MASTIMILGSSYSTKCIATLGIGLIGGLTCTAMHRIISTFFWKWIVKSFKFKKKDIIVINSDKEMKLIFSHFERKAQVIAAVGFDCEWIQMKGKRRPVALLQLATHSGMCILIRLCQMDNNVPLPVKQFLGNKNILKVGVGIDVDKQNLLKDHDIIVRGCVDLRHLEMMLVNCSSTDLQQDKNGLQALAKKHLNKTLNKDWRVRAGDWEAEELTATQIEYAAEDASVGIHILLHLMAELWKPPTFFFFWLPFSWKSYIKMAVNEICYKFVDCKFGNQSSGSAYKKINLKDYSHGQLLKEISKGHSSRQTPLYHNSQLWTSDGETLCICDPRKAQWYVDKGLGFIKQENPFIVQLNFEPAGRPNIEGADGLFYLQERLNVCVVCGKDDSYIRKNIIPHEYRKYFPDILKSHQNHDVVLLCVKCHQISNVKDFILRQNLSDECNAPLANEVDVKETISGKLKQIRKAGNALVRSHSKLPPSKIKYLENILKDYFKVKTLTDDLIKVAANFEIKNLMKEENDTHGFKVYLNYKKIGLILLEQRWREWFLFSMEPKCLPENWSINHNHSKLKVKMSRLPLDHPVREDYKEALVGTNGYLDIPYRPNSIE